MILPGQVRVFLKHDDDDDTIRFVGMFAPNQIDRLIEAVTDYGLRDGVSRLFYKDAYFVFDNHGAAFHITINEEEQNVFGSYGNNSSGAYCASA